MTESELSQDAVRGLKHLDLQGMVVIVTDGSRTLQAAVEELGSCHFLCRKYLLATLSSVASGLKDLDLDEDVTYHKNAPNRYMELALEKLNDLFREDKMISKEADELFMKELKLKGGCWIVE
eukprot:augustus_masked-scaffold_15-processed-gene-2.12-mRNA-1 protein AED:1.00 eAED:1.00 QI:0/0/0/0/1/1/2/0/121